MYLRPIGHLCAIKREIAVKYKFAELPKEKDRGSDVRWAISLVRDKAVKTETHIDNTLYFYNRNFDIFK